MFRILFLILIAMSSFVFAQTEQKPEAIKFDEFEKATNGNVKMRIEAFHNELNGNPTASGYIISYGTPKEVATREKQIRAAIAFRKYDTSRITFVNGGFRSVIKTELWLVPYGAQSPRIEGDSKTKSKPTTTTTVKPYRFESIGKQTTERYFKYIFSEMFIKLSENNNLESYVVIYSDDENFAVWQERIRNLSSFESRADRIFFVKGNVQKDEIVELWIAQKGAEVPKFTSPKAEKFDEFGKVSNAEWLKRMKILGKKLDEIKYGNLQLFIINYGTEKDINVAESLIEKYLFKNCRDCFGYSNVKINYLRGSSTGKARRVFWIVPFGAKMPIP